MADSTYPVSSLPADTAGAPQPVTVPPVAQLRPFVQPAAARAQPPRPLDRTAAQSFTAQPGLGRTEDIPARQETIEIAPHPTTNRFPWAPVANPTIPVYEVASPAEIPLPVPPATTAPPVVAMSELPSFPADLPTWEPPLPPVPEPSLPLTEPVLPPPPVAVPIIAEPVVSLPVPEAPLPAPPLEQLAASPAPVQPELQPITTAPAPMQQPAPKRRLRSKSVHIYSDYTQEVWKVFRPSKTIRLMIFATIAVLIGLVAIIWLMNGAQTNVFDLPFLQPLLHAE